MILLICQLTNLFLLAIFARIILSYFPIAEGGALSSIYGVLYTITEPVLGPLRNLLPNIGMFDISPIVVLLGIQILSGLVLGCGPGFL